MSIIAIIVHYSQLFVIIYLIICLINFLIIVINLFWNQLFAIIGRDGHSFHASGRQHMIAARTGTRLSSVWPDHLCSQTKRHAQIQPFRHTNGQCTCYYWAYFSYYCDYCAFLCSILAQFSRCRSHNNDYQEQG